MVVGCDVYDFVKFSIFFSFQSFFEFALLLLMICYKWSFCVFFDCYVNVFGSFLLVV